jgi:DNA-binding protein H-NS
MGGGVLFSGEAMEATRVGGGIKSHLDVLVFHLTAGSNPSVLRSWEVHMARPSNIASMSVEALLKLRSDIGKVLSRKADELKSQIAQLGGGIVGHGMAPTKRRGSAMKGRKVAPKYRSRKDPKLTWAGRGATPVWMRSEMKAGKLKEEAFLIK